MIFENIELFLKILFFILYTKYEEYSNLYLLYTSCHLRIQCCFLLLVEIFWFFTKIVLKEIFHGLLLFHKVSLNRLWSIYCSE